MYRIALIDMPFASIHIPSIALTQIKDVLETAFQDQVRVDLLYLKNDFAKYVGFDVYQHIATSMRSLNAGLGDWLFRGVAFPDLPDNTAEYLRRYLFSALGETRQIHALITQKRPHFKAFFNKLIYKYHLDEVNLVGFTSMFMQNTATFAMARLIKQLNPRTVVVMGGANCEYPMGGVIAKFIQDVDYVFSGPALVNFPQFVKYLMEGTQAEIDSLRGILRKGNAELSREAAVGEELTIDTVIELNYDSFLSQFEQYFRGTSLKCVLPFETSRGCWWGQRAHCTFCGLNGATMAYRSMKPELAVQQIRNLFRYEGRVQQLTAVDNILPKNYIREVLPHLMTPASMGLFYEVKADLSEADLAILASARVTQIQPGIEALDTSTLKLMKKGTTAFQNIGLLKSCLKYGIDPCWNLLIGFPGESERVYQRYVEQIPKLVHLPPPSGVYPVRFDRYSPYFYRAQEYKLNLTPLDYYSFIYPFAVSDMQNFAYYFGDNNVDADYFNFTAKWIDRLRARVEEWKAKWDASGRPLARLHFKENTNDTVVYDSRSGEGIEHSLSPIESAVLKRLFHPIRKEILVGETQMQDVENEINRLLQLGLIFEEEGRLLSLVVDLRHLEPKTTGPSGMSNLFTVPDVAMTNA